MTDKIALTSAEQTRYNALRAVLRDAGYVDIEQHGQLRPGMRIRHRGQQWLDAMFEGTGVVLAITEKPDSPWSRSWGMADVELIALWDKPWPLDSRLSQLAQYHVSLAINADVAVLDTRGGQS